MTNKMNEELLEMVTGGVLAVPSVKNEPKIKKGEETGTVDTNRGEATVSPYPYDECSGGGASGGWG